MILLFATSVSFKTSQWYLKEGIIASAGRSTFISSPTIIANKCEKRARDHRKQFPRENRLSFLTLARLLQQQENENTSSFGVSEKALGRAVGIFSPCRLLGSKLK